MAILNETLADMPPHPYSPLGVSVPGYVVNSMSMPALVGAFAAGTSLMLLATLSVAKMVRPSIGTGPLLATMWFVVCGFIHFFFEGYFARNFMDMASQTDLFGQLWKEYSLSDSRYLTQDSFVVCMEAITALFWGPLSFYCAYCILVDHPHRHPVQLIVSLGQLYGDVLYYATCLFEHTVYGIFYCRPESFYFWAYFVFCNAFWIVIPLILLWGSVKEMAAAAAKVKALEKASKRK
ncbi:Emopamil-binding protein [Stachybotrys elegans]|uniref:Emopamil-binding protein n=1 Tax=Stachybotrys elegans TaxID=80388 RepID=A0A8K0T0X1_9HYPO|nr:Emopamil-binding protein [Stachybotrys elegans]